MEREKRRGRMREQKKKGEASWRDERKDERIRVGQQTGEKRR